MIPPREYVSGDSIGSSGLGEAVRISADMAVMLNGLVAGLRAASKLTGVPPLMVTQDQGGRRLSLDRPRKLWGVLAGSGNPYTFTEQTYIPGTGWTTPPGATTDTGYELNGVGGLGGKVVRLTNVGVADWRFQYHQGGAVTPTCPCGCCCIPTVLAMFSSITPTQQSTLGLSVGWGEGDSPIVFTYGLSPIQTLGIPAATSGPSGNIFFYVQLPEYAWFSQTFSKLGGTYQYMLWVSDCTIYTALFQVGSVTVSPTLAGGSPSLNGATWFDTSLTTGVAVDGVFITTSAAIIEVFAAVPASCASFPISTFSIFGSNGHGSTNALELVSETGYADYYGSCVELDNTGSASAPSGSLSLTGL